MTNENIMVAVDFGATSLGALETAIDLARRLSVPLDIVHVCSPVPLAQAEGSTQPDEENANAELERVRAWAVTAGVAATVHLRRESVIFGLLEVIEELSPRLVVLGSHGRTGLSRALLGSVSESIARRSSVPVLIVPAPEREKMAAGLAWSCSTCGHIRARGEGSLACSRCGASPARWLSAPLSHEPADAGEAAIGEGVATDAAPIATQDATALFAVAPAGVSGSETNAELRIRRF